MERCVNAGEAVAAGAQAHLLSALGVEMGIGNMFRRAQNTISELGLDEMLRFAPEYLSELVRHRSDIFDRRYGTDTNRSVPVSDLDGVGHHQDSAELYWPVRESSFLKVLKAVDLPLAQFTFIDLGCGKGRVLILAAEQGCSRVIGVEFSAKLCEVARTNVGLFRKARPAAPPTEVVCQNATSYVFPDGPLLLFLFDPFGPAVLQPVIDRLCTSLRADPRPCRVAYYLPMHRTLFEQSGFSPLAEQHRNWRMAYPWVVLKGPSG
jgi:hypothetical protein